MTAFGDIRTGHLGKTAQVAIATVLTVALTSAAPAQVVRSVIPVQPLVVLADAAATNPETVAFWSGFPR